MKIDLIISSLSERIEGYGHTVSLLPLDLFLSSNQTGSRVVCITESTQSVRPSFDSWNSYVVDAVVQIDISVKSNDNEISLADAQEIRDDVITSIRSAEVEESQIIIRRCDYNHDKTGNIRYTIECDVRYSIQ